jgi:SAM-dependent methyltransferase
MSVWIEYSRCYDRVMEAWTPYQDLLEKARGALVGPVLDVGCGTGLLAARCLADGTVVEALDSSPEMVEVARLRGVPARIGDALELPFAASSFNSVACINLIPSIDTPSALLREIRRVLRPGGRLVLSGFKPGPDFALLRARTVDDFTRRGLDDILHDVFPRFEACNRSIGAGLRNLYTLPEVVRLLHLLGFGSIVDSDESLYYGQAWMVTASR